MKALRDALDKVHPLFAKGGPLAFAYPMYEALDTFLLHARVKSLTGRRTSATAST